MIQAVHIFFCMIIHQVGIIICIGPTFWRWRVTQGLCGLIRRILGDTSHRCPANFVAPRLKERPSISHALCSFVRPPPYTSSKASLPLILLLLLFQLLPSIFLLLLVVRLFLITFFLLVLSLQLIPLVLSAVFSPISTFSYKLNHLQLLFIPAISLSASLTASLFPQHQLFLISQLFLYFIPVVAFLLRFVLPSAFASLRSTHSCICA